MRGSRLLYASVPGVIAASILAALLAGMPGGTGERGRPAPAATGPSGELAPTTTPAGPLGGVGAGGAGALGTRACCIDLDGDGYGVAAPRGPDADDHDPGVNTPATALARHGSLRAFLAHAGYRPGRIFHVAPRGDNATGRADHPDKPFAIFGREIREQIRPGDVVVFREGVYLARNGIGTLYPAVTGKPGRPIVFVAYPGERVVLDCAEDGISIPGATDLVFDGFVLSNSDRNRRGNGVYMHDSARVTFRNIESRNHARGFMATHIEDILIEDCVLHDNPGSHGIYLNAHQRTSANITVRRCLVYRNAMHGIQFNGRVTGLAIEDNIIHSNTLGGVSLLMGVCDSDVRGNLIFNNNKQGVIFYLYESGVDWAPANDQCGNVVENNVIWIGRYNWDGQGSRGAAECSAILFDDSTKAKDRDMVGNVVRHNILVTQDGPAVSFRLPKHAEGTTVTGNLIFRAGGRGSVGELDGRHYDLASFERSFRLAGGNEFRDPRFADVSPYYYKTPERFDFSRRETPESTKVTKAAREKDGK